MALAPSSASVSVVIPAYNSGHLVGEAIESAIRQSAPPAEVIVVDDGSTDDTPRRLESYADRVRYVRQSNQGVAAARNRGVAEARGDFVAFLDADDVWHPRKVELQVAALAGNSDVGLIGTRRFDWPAETVPEIPDIASPPVVRVRREGLAVKNRFVTSSVVVRRPILECVGPFDTRLQGPEDHDLWLRVADVSAMANIDLPLTGYRDVPASLSKRAASMEAGMQRILRKLDERGAWRGCRALRRKAYSYVDHSCAYMYGTSGYPGTGMRRTIRSLLRYPLPYRRDEVRTHLERPKLFIINLLRLLRLRGID